MRYQILELLGAGGMGQVYRAHDASLGRDVALKILRGDDPRLLERAQREARHQARIDHENVGHVYEVGELDGKPFVAMQLVDGRTLDVAGLEMTLAEKVEVMRAVAEGVQAAHSRGLVHRDLKPGNVLVERREDGWHPWVVDFGLALDPEQPGMTATGAMVGTAAYMAPEQIRGERSSLDRRTDVYALGATFFELLAGRAPFLGKHPVEVVMKALSEEAPALRKVEPQLPVELEHIVARCLEKDPERRYPSARLLAEDLERFLLGESVLAQAPSVVYRLRKAVARHRAIAVVAGIAMAVVLATAAVALRVRWQAREEARLAQELGREAEQVATALRMAELAPRHDLAPEKDRLRRRIAALEAKVGELGAAGRGPGWLAAAEGYLSLGDLETARDRLEDAAATGYRSPELSRGLGRTLGRMYRTRLDEVRHLDERWRGPQLVRERTELLLPALEQLSGLPAPSAEDRAFEALLRGDLDRAESSALSAVEQAPWDHRVRLLRAEIRSEAAHRAFENGDPKVALSALGSAREILRATREIGRSDPAVYRADCALTELRFEVELLGSLPAGEELAAYLEPCELAVATDTSDPSNLARRAGLHRHLGARAMRRGEDPLPELEAAIADAEAALTLDPRLTGALYQSGVAHSLRANHAAGSEEEIARDLERAGTLLERCVDQAPGFLPCRVSLGVNRLETGIDLDNQHQSSREAFESSIVAFEAAIELAPEMAVLHNDLGYTRSYLAEVLLQEGEDPRPRLELARRSLTRATELAPDYATARLSLGESHRVEARYLVARREDPGVAVAAAEASYLEALELDPERFWAAFLRLDTHLYEVDYRLETGGDPGAALTRAREALTRLEEVAGEPMPCDEARVLLREGRAPGGDPDDLWPRALRLAATEDCALLRARILRHRAESLLDRGADPTPDLEGAGEQIQALSAESSGRAEGLALLAEVEWLRARHATDPATRRRAAQRSAAARERALEIFPVATPRWGPLLEAARRAAGGG